MKTYREVYEMISNYNHVYVPVFYIKGTMEWYKIDKTFYLSTFSEEYTNWDMLFPCHVEIDNWDDVFIQPRVENI
jgi:hypothetical protein